MLIISVSILNLAVQIYFPPSAKQEVELQVVEEPKQVVKLPEDIEKPKKMEKQRKITKTRKRR
jgi:hypothetical protein